MAVGAGRTRMQNILDSVKKRARPDPNFWGPVKDAVTGGKSSFPISEPDASKRLNFNRWRNPLVNHASTAPPATGWKSPFAKAGNFAKNGAPGFGMMVGGQALGAASDYLPPAPRAVGESAATGMNVAGAAQMLGAPKAWAGPAGVAFGAADIGARALAGLGIELNGNKLGSKDGIIAMAKDAFGGGEGNGYDELAGQPLADVFDELGLTEDERADIRTKVDGWAKDGRYDEMGTKILEGDYQDGGQPAVSMGIMEAHKVSQERVSLDRQLKLQKMNMDLLQKIGGKSVQRAERGLERARASTAGMDPVDANQLIRQAEARVDTAAATSDAYLEQTMVMPAWNAHVAENKKMMDMETEAKDAVIRQQLAEKYDGGGAFPIE